MMATRRARKFWDSLKTIVYAVLIALVIRTVAFEPFNIPSGSMKPTLLVGDYLFISKYSYGYSRYSLPLGLPLIPGRILDAAPARGDVAVFKLPSDNKSDYIKRIVGMPGDRIQLREGRLYINGEQIVRRRVADFIEVDGLGRVRRTAQFDETLPNGRTYRILENTDRGQLDNTPVYAVPAGHYFALGDNRDNSLDSRVLSGVGFVPAVNLLGRAEILFFSVDGSARLWEFWRWPAAIRFERFFDRVE